MSKEFCTTFYFSYTSVFWPCLCNCKKICQTFTTHTTLFLHRIKDQNKNLIFFALLLFWGQLFLVTSYILLSWNKEKLLNTEMQYPFLSIEELHWQLILLTSPYWVNEYIANFYPIKTAGTANCGVSLKGKTLLHEFL